MPCAENSAGVNDRLIACSQVCVCAAVCMHAFVHACMPAHAHLALVAASRMKYLRICTCTLARHEGAKVTFPVFYYYCVRVRMRVRVRRASEDTHSCLYSLHDWMTRARTICREVFLRRGCPAAATTILTVRGQLMRFLVGLHAAPRPATHSRDLTARERSSAREVIKGNARKCV